MTKIKNMLKKMNVASLIMLILSEICAEFCIERYAKKNALHFLWGGIVLYALTIFLFVRTLREDSDLQTVNTLWQTGNVIFIALFSIIFLKSKVTIKKIIGLICGIISVILMST